MLSKQFPDDKIYFLGLVDQTSDFGPKMHDSGATCLSKYAQKLFVNGHKSLFKTVPPQEEQIGIFIAYLTLSDNGVDYDLKLYKGGHQKFS